MFDEVVHLYIFEQLKRFFTGSRCCTKFAEKLHAIDPEFFARVVSDFGLRMRPYVYDGEEAILVNKDRCHHVSMDAMDLRLCTVSVKDMFLLHYCSDFPSSQDDDNDSSDSDSSEDSLPKVPAHRFSLGPLKQSIARNNPMGQQSFQSQCPMQPFKDMILDALGRNRVLVVNAGSALDKSTAIPMYIIEKCSEERSHCKIICVEREQLVAVYNSERLAAHCHEKVGETVAYQMQLQSRISESSNLVYTTSSFLLRVLMGQPMTESFRHISHVVVADVQLHEAYADLLLRELKQGLIYHPYLKIVLLSNHSCSREFLQYFGEGEELKLNENQADCCKSEVLYIEHIRRCLGENRPSKMMDEALKALTISSNSVVKLNTVHMDRCLEAYERTGSDDYFDKVLYMVKVECANINHRNSITGRTALNIASMLGKIEHVKMLLQLFADPFVTDIMDVDALKAAISMGHTECVELLKVVCFDNMPSQKDWQEANIDHRLITDILHFLTSNDQWHKGNIVVCLPSYQHLIQLNYTILKEKLLGNLPDEIVVYLLHNQTDKSKLDIIMQSDQSKIKIVLSTDIAESLLCFEDILYVIDSARSYRCVFNNESQGIENVYEWSSKHSLENRRLLLRKNGGGICFRLMPEAIYEQLPEVRKPDLLTMPLDRVCLAVKLLDRQSMVAEYFQETIIIPPFLHVFRCVENLKKISVFTETEDITWLGCRLIDVPVDCRLGKLLVLAILLQCLDPVLTIVSFMSTLDPFEISQFLDDSIAPYKDTIRSKIKDERLRYSEGTFSDQMTLLRLYQQWQNGLRDSDADSVPNKYTFVLNGVLEYVCNARTQLVGALRSSQLIHTKGNLSMHYINHKSNSWPVIKAALVGGLYPHLCVFDRKCNMLKSPFKTELVLHPDSVLRGMELDSLKKLDFVSPWILYGNISKGSNCNSITYNTVVTAITVALFAGLQKFSLPCYQITTAENSECYFQVDEWISFKMDHDAAQLCFKTRQVFHNVYSYYLENCANLEKYKNVQQFLTKHALLFDYIEKILVQEDVEHRFAQPERIGIRPKAVPNKLCITLSGNLLMAPTMRRLQVLMAGGHHRFDKRQYIMVYKQESIDLSNLDLNADRKSEWYHMLMQYLDSITISYQLTFVIFYSRNPDCLTSVNIAQQVNGSLELHSCFRYSINLKKVMNNLPNGANKALFSFGTSQWPLIFALDRNTGIFILNMFAYRNNWLHN